MEALNVLYIDSLIKKFEFIKGIWITDLEGNLLASSVCSDIGLNSTDSPRSSDNKDLNSVKIPLSFIFNTVVEQTNKIEKWKTKNLTSIYENFTVFQSKVNKSIFVHFISDSKKFNYEIVKEISNEIKEKLIKIEGELENLTQCADNN